MLCKSCGASNEPGAHYCAFCGSHLPLTETTEKSAIYQRIKSSSQWKLRESPERLAQLPKFGAFQKIFFGGFFIVFIGVAIFISIMMCVVSGVFGLIGIGFTESSFGAGFSIIPIFMAILPLGMAVFGLFLFMSIRNKMNEVENSPVVAVPVIVVGRRNHVSGGGENSSSSTHYFVTCELDDGQRQEYQLWDGLLYGRMAEEDAGVLFTKSNYGLDFDRVVL